MHAFTRYAVPTGILVVLVFAALAPLLRSRFAYGRWGLVVMDEASSVQRVVGSAMAFLFAVILALAVGCAVLGPERLGAWSVPLPIAFVGCALVSIATLVVVVAQHQMGASWRIGIDHERTELVTLGLYRVVRNPIFGGMIVAMIGMTILLPCAWTLMTTVMAIVVIEIQTRLEEQHLQALHGERYRRYAAEVGRFFPRVGRLA